MVETENYINSLLKEIQKYKTRVNELYAENTKLKVLNIGLKKDITLYIRILHEQGIDPNTYFQGERNYGRKDESGRFH